MTNDTSTYEPPALIEVGEFTDLTLGMGSFPRIDGVIYLFPIP